jgi:acetylglutamate kinase
VARKAKSTTRTIADRFDGTVLEQPVVVANKTFLAGLGLAHQIWTGFGARFDACASDGEKIRQRATKQVESFRKDANSNIDTARENAIRQVNQVVQKVLSVSPVATSSDIDALNAKLDKVMAAVAK